MTLTGAKSFRINADMAGLDVYIDALGDAVDKAVRPAAQAAAQVLYDQVKMNVAGLGKKTGNLANSIYQKYSPENSQDGKRATYHISWNASKAPHGHLVEYGYLQRYKYYQDDQGRVRPMVRPGMEGKKRPGRRASAAEKAAYYVTLPTPIQVLGKAFVRRAAGSMDKALKAAEEELIKHLLWKSYT